MKREQKCDKDDKALVKGDKGYKDDKDDTDLALAHVDCLRKQGDIALVINLINQSMSN